MDLNKRIASFATLGKLLPDLIGSSVQDKAFRANRWFTPSETGRALRAWANLLTEKNLNHWIDGYRLQTDIEPLNILVVTAGNIPLVGFHDFLTVLISGHRFIGKLSSRDDILLTRLAEELVRIEPGFATLIKGFGPGIEPDAVIATGSDNTARYFRKNFGHLPNIIRKNRSSAAILDGQETDAELCGLTDDMLDYYGLGCRSISHLYLPYGSDPALLIPLILNEPKPDPCDPMLENLRFQRARLSVLGRSFIDSGRVLLVESDELHSPIGIIQYSYYENAARLFAQLSAFREEIQCLSGHHSGIPGLVPFGSAQQPGLDDYADCTDTLRFLSTLTVIQ